MEQRLDPFDVLVSLGVIRRSEILAADGIESAASTTMVARLVAVGVEADVLLRALSRLTNIPLATPAILAGAVPMPVPRRFVPLMRQLLTAPVGRVDEGILQIVVADPRVCKKLNAAGIAHRPFLALEADVVHAMQAVWPDEEAVEPLSLSDPTERNLPVAPRPISTSAPSVDDPSSSPRPVSVLDGEVLPGIDDPDGYVAMAALGTDVDLDAFVTVPQPISIDSPPPPAIADTGPSDAETPAAVEAAAPRVDIAPAAAPIVDDGALVVDAAAVSDVFAVQLADSAPADVAPAPEAAPAADLSPPRGVALADTLAPADASPVRVDGPSAAAAAAVGAAMEFDEPTDVIAARRRAAALSASQPHSVPSLIARVRGRAVALASLVSAVRGQRGVARAGAVAAVVVVVALVIVTAVVIGSGDAQPEDDLARQARLVDEARAFAADGEHAWAIAHCADAVQIDSTTHFGKQAAILCAEEGALLGEQRDDAVLARLVESLPADDPLRAEAVLALDRVEALAACDACAPDTRPRIKVAPATPTPKVKPKKRPQRRR